jgi:hypothetical protein
MRKLDNKNIDKVGRALVKASALAPGEIEDIVGDRVSFDSIRKRIASEADHQKPSRRWVGASVTVLSACAVLFAAAAFFFFPSSTTNVVMVRPVPVPEIAPATRFTEPDHIVNPAGLPAPVAMPRPERVSTLSPTQTATKVSASRKPAAQKNRNENEFYALSYAGDPNETERGGRIVRVDLPRTVLFAMGVDIPLENEVETVKADLLIGSDGVTRAIRVVR